MAKIGKLEYDINGVHYCTNINCNTKGDFIANLPTEVAEKLNMHKELIFTTLQGLQNHFKETIERYKNSATTEEVFILIRYGASGKFNSNKHGGVLFFDKYGVRLQFTSDHADILLFHFKVCIKETVDGEVNWFETRLGKDHPFWDKEQQANPDKYYKTTKIFKVTDYKAIPYSETALQTLRNAQEKLRAVSEMLFTFIEQEESEIFLTLTNQKLLS